MLPKIVDGLRDEPYIDIGSPLPGCRLITKQEAMAS